MSSSGFRLLASGWSTTVSGLSGGRNRAAVKWYRTASADIAKESVLISTNMYPIHIWGIWWDKKPCILEKTCRRKIAFLATYHAWVSWKHICPVSYSGVSLPQTLPDFLIQNFNCFFLQKNDYIRWIIGACSKCRQHKEMLARQLILTIKALSEHAQAADLRAPSLASTTFAV